MGCFGEIKVEIKKKTKEVGKNLRKLMKIWKGKYLKILSGNVR